VYATAEEEATRFGYFVENMKKAERLRRANPLAGFGVKCAPLRGRKGLRCGVPLF
jgi:hypothetical protein